MQIAQFSYLNPPRPARMTFRQTPGPEVSEQPSLPDDRVQPDPTEPDRRIFCFERPEEERAFNLSLTKLVGIRQKNAQAKFVSPQNVLSMKHGQQWIYTARELDSNTSLHSISTEYEIPSRGIAENDLGLIGRLILSVSDEISRRFEEYTYSIVGGAAERAGTVVDAKAAGTMAASLIEMMSKIELGVDRDGTVTMPQLHVGAGAYLKFVEAMNNMTPEDAAEFERLKQLKSQEALEREAGRRAKFRRADS